MMCLRLLLVLFLAESGMLLAGAESTTVAKSFQAHQVIPDVIPRAPEALLSVKYPSGVTVSEGNELTPTQVKDVPEVKWDADDNSYYTLVMTDPDAPSRANPKSREWHHWLVGNIKGSAVSTGETLSGYIGSGPPPDTGLHRYVILVYRQSGKIKFNEARISNTTGANRGKFSVAKFAEKYSLGDPIAGNFYQAEFDDYVPILKKKLKA